VIDHGIDFVGQQLFFIVRSLTRLADYNFLSKAVPQFFVGSRLFEIAS